MSIISSPWPTGSSPIASSSITPGGTTDTAFSDMLSGQMNGAAPQSESTASDTAAISSSQPADEAGIPVAQISQTGPDMAPAPAPAPVDAVDMLALMLELRTGNLATTAPAQAATQTAGPTAPPTFAMPQAQSAAVAATTSRLNPAPPPNSGSLAASQATAAATRQKDEPAVEALAPDASASASLPPLAAAQLAVSSNDASQEAREDRLSGRETGDTAPPVPDALMVALAGGGQTQAQAIATRVQTPAEPGSAGTQSGLTGPGTPTLGTSDTMTPASGADRALAAEWQSAVGDPGENRGDSAKAAADARPQPVIPPRAVSDPGEHRGDSAKAATDVRPQPVILPPTDPLVTASVSQQGLGEAQEIGIGPAAPMMSPPGNPTVESTTPTTPTVRHEILTGFGNRGWDQAISQRVLWLAQDQLQQASLTLNPPHLGPIQVTVQIENQQAMVQFVSAQPEVRQALQDSIPVLREMFGQAGIELGQTDIGSRNPERGTRQPDPSAPLAQAGDADLSLEELATSLPLLARGQGLINLFA